MEVAGFLRQHPPFDGLGDDDLAGLAGSVLVEFFPQGTTILEQDGKPAEYLYVVRSGAVDIVHNGQLVDLAREGDAFGELSLVSGSGPSATVRAHEDTLCYLIDPGRASEVLASTPGLSMIGTAIRRLASRTGHGAGREDFGRIRVNTLIRRPPVSIEPQSTVAEAATRMAQERISCLLISANGGWGILTDRDLRTRVLASGRSPETKVAEVMTSPARTIPPDSMAGEALLVMLDGGFHHLPIVDSRGGLVGVVTDTDVMGQARQSPFALKSAVERSPGREEAISAARRIPTVAAELVEANVDPVDIGHVVGVAIDALTRRLIELAIDDLGDPPARWAWLALGSEARHEQALSTDQDHALAYEPASDDADLDPYFAALAEAVTSGLEAAGIPRCRGDAMAVHPSLRRPLPAWLTQFQSWMSDPGVEGSVLTSITFDYRRLAGPLDMESLLDELIRTVPAKYPQFLRHLARRALDQRPPTGFFRDLVVQSRGEHAGRLDVKHGGIMIVTSLARAWALRAGRTVKPTLERLRGAVASGQIDEETRKALEEAFRLLWQVRLDHQAEMVRAGRPPDDFVDPASLGPITRRGLKEAFRIITREQRSLSADLGVR